MRLFHTPPDRYFYAGLFPEPVLREIEIDGAPDWLRGTRMLFVCDVHLRRGVSDARLEAFADRLAAVNADMLLLGGDYADSPRDCTRFFRAMERASFPMGSFAVPGNNDFRSLRELRAGAAAAGIALLENECRQVPLRGGALEIGGCEDHKYGDPRTRDLFSNDGAYRILLSHYPAPPECECELMLCGHTHAGQFNLLGLTPYSLGVEHKFRLIAVRGLHRIDGMWLFVGNGVGVSRLPLRFGAEPQIYLLKFGDK